MKVFDSKKQQLSMSEIVMYALQNIKDKINVPVEHAMLSIVAECQMPNTDTMLYGNTVFLTHYSEDKKMAVMRAFNVDTAKNYMLSGEKYFRKVLGSGVESMVTQFDVESYGVPLKQIQRNKLGTVHVEKAKDGAFIALVQMNKQRGKNAVQS